MTPVHRRALANSLDGQAVGGTRPVPRSATAIRLVVLVLVVSLGGASAVHGQWDALMPPELDLLRAESSDVHFVSGDDESWLFPCGVCKTGWADEDVDDEYDDADELASTKSPPPGFVSILIDTDRLTLIVNSDEQVWHRFTVAVGKSATPTPLGEWRIATRAVWGGAFGSRWLGLSVPWASYGIHGTNRPSSIGSRASHGCIRMRNRDVEVLYRWVTVGTPVKIVGTPRSHFGEVPRNMARGSTVGSDVVRLQLALRELGLYMGPIDGWFGSGTYKAVGDFQWSQLMKVTGRADAETRRALGLP